MTPFHKLLAADFKLQTRHSTQWAALVLFFIIVLLLLPFAIGPDPDLLRRLAPGLIWLSALLMTLLSLDGLFMQDVSDGTFDIMALSSHALPLLVASRLLVQSFILILVMLIMLVPASFLLGLDGALAPALATTFILGLPTLVFMGGIMAAVTVGLQRNPALLTLLLIPFYIPILIFAITACDASMMGQTIKPHLCLLGALLALILPAAPFLITMALRQEQG